MANLTDRVMGSFYVRTSFPCFTPHPNKQVTSINFSNDGERLVASTNYRMLKIYNCDTSEQEFSLQLNKYGCGFTNFMDSNDRVLITSTSKKSHSIRELNIVKNAYQTIYHGHTDLVSSFAVHREKKIFLTAGHDKSIRLWDFRCESAQGASTNMIDTPLVAFEPNGEMFIVGLNSKLIEMYDLRGITSGPFSEIRLNPDESKWQNLKFSPNGKLIMINSLGKKFRLIDSVMGRNQQMYIDRQNTLNIPIDVSFTPNSDYILTGSSSGHLAVYSNNRLKRSDEGKVVETLSKENEPITAVEFNPKYTLIATASSHVAFWIPDIQ